MESVHLLLCSLRIHRKLKEVAVFRYTKKVDKDDGSVSILFSYYTIYTIGLFAYDHS